MSDLPTVPGVKRIAGVDCLRDAKGAWIPVKRIKEHELLEDGLVRDLVEQARAAQAALLAFKQMAFAQVDAYGELLDQKYGLQAGGAKGNWSLTTFDGTLQVSVAVADRIEFGPSLQQAKALIDECVVEWAAGGNDKLVTIANHAFRRDSEGQVNPKALLGLKRYNFEDERWLRAMQAIDDSIRIVGSKRFIHFRWRDKPDGKWQPIALNIAVD